MLHLVDRLSAAQDGHRPPYFSEGRQAGHDRLCADGHSTETPLVLAETGGK